MTNRKKPEFRGSFVGQIVYSEKLVKTGRRVFVEQPDGSTAVFPVREKRGVTHWVWDGSEWIRGDRWEEMMKARRGGKKFVKPPGVRLR